TPFIRDGKRSRAEGDKRRATPKPGLHCVARRALADTAVDVTAADWRNCGACGGDADRRAIRKCYRSATGIDGMHRTRAPSRVRLARRPCAGAVPGRWGLARR